MIRPIFRVNSVDSVFFQNEKADFLPSQSVFTHHKKKKKKKKKNHFFLQKSEQQKKNTFFYRNLRRKGKQRRSRGRGRVRARVVWICFEYRTEGKGEMGGERGL